MAKAKDNVYGAERISYKIWDKTNKKYVYRNTKSSNQYEWDSTTWVDKFIKESLCSKRPPYRYGSPVHGWKRRTPEEFEVHKMKTILVEVL